MGLHHGSSLTQTHQVISRCLYQSQQEWCSTSVGVRGASVTVGHGKTRTNVGIPGTGISYNTIESNSEKVSLPSSESNKGMSMGKLFLYGIAGLFLTIFILVFFRLI